MESLPNKYTMHSMTISNNEGVQEDIKQIFTRFSLTESIYANYIGAMITVVDGINLFNRIGFTGQEYIRIHFSGVEGITGEVPFEESIDVTLRVFKVSKVQQDSTGTTQTYNLFCISPQKFPARRNRLSKAYSGSLSDITAKILENELNISQEPEKVADGRFMSVREQSEPDNIHVVIPNWTIEHTLGWLCGQMTKETGTYRDNFYLYQTCRDGYRLNTIEDMINIKYLGGEVVFGEPQSGTGNPETVYDDDGTGGQSRAGPGMDIYDRVKYNLFDTVDNTNKGVYGGRRITINPTNKIYQEIDYSILGQEEWETTGEGEWKGGTHISKSPPFRLQREHYRHPADGAMGEEDLGQAMTVESWDPIYSYNQSAIDLGYEPTFAINGVNDNTINVHKDTALHNFRRNAVKELLDASSMNMVISGRTNINCGIVINVDLKQPIPGGDKIEDEITHNGEMLITELTFQGTPAELVCQLTCVKDGYEVNWDGYEMPPTVTKSNDGGL